MSLKLTGFVGLLMAISGVVGLPEGAPEKACGDMVPKHGSNTKQSSPAPYRVVPSANSTKPGGQITVTIEPDGSSNTTTALKGFMLRAEYVNGNKKVAGYFKKGSKYQLRDCSGNDTTVTHEGRGDKAKVTATWIAPDEGGSSVIFYATVAKTGKLFWVRIPSVQVKIEK